MTQDSRDILTLWLSELRMSDVFTVEGYIGGGRGVLLPGEGGLAMHYVQEGQVIVEVDGTRHGLGPGDVILMPSGLSRSVETEGADELTPISDMVPMTPVSGELLQFHLEGLGVGAQVLGVAACIQDRMAPALRALPPFLVLRGETLPRRLRGQLDHLVEEAKGGLLMSGPLVARIAEVVLLFVARAALLSGELETPLITGARDPNLSRALMAIHSAPAKPWSVESLGKLSGMSRSGFAARFSSLIGETPMAYLAGERMRRATELLMGNAAVQEVAEAVGYRSVAAFSTAFSRVRGYPPSQVSRGAVSH